LGEFAIRQDRFRAGKKAQGKEKSERKIALDVF